MNQANAQMEVLKIYLHSIMYQTLLYNTTYITGLQWSPIGGQKLARGPNSTNVLVVWLSEPRSGYIIILQACNNQACMKLWWKQQMCGNRSWILVVSVIVLVYYSTKRCHIRTSYAWRPAVPSFTQLCPSSKCGIIDLHALPLRFILINMWH